MRQHAGQRYLSLALSLLLLWGGGCPTVAHAREKWGPFRGQLVDAETGAPIAGAAVLVVWYEAVPTPVQTNQRFYEALETVTDAAGRFAVPRLTPPFFSFRIFPPQITYFAPGYEPYKKVVTPPDGEPFVAPTVVQMRRLKTRQELWEKSRSRPGDVPLEMMVEFTKAINVERRMLGLKPLPIEQEKGKQP